MPAGRPAPTTYQPLGSYQQPTAQPVAGFANGGLQPIGQPTTGGFPANGQPGEGYPSAGPPTGGGFPAAGQPTGGFQSGPSAGGFQPISQQTGGFPASGPPTGGFQSSSGYQPGLTRQARRAAQEAGTLDEYRPWSSEPSGGGARIDLGGQAPARRTKRRRMPKVLVTWGFLAPALILFTYFKFLPIAQGLRDSFYEVRPYLGDRYVGLQNYQQVLSNEDLLRAIWQTVLIAGLTTIGSVLFGLILALLVEGQARHLRFVRTVAFLPVVTTMAVVAEVWRLMYYPNKDGLINTVIGWVGVGPSQFLVNEDSALGSVVLVGIWRGAPYDMMIFLAGLAAVNRHLYESAAVDGASRLRRFIHVTMPALRPVVTILLLLAALRGMRIFTEVFLLTNGAPNGSTEVLMTLIYKLGLERGELGVAAAGSMALTGVTVIITLAVHIWRRRAPL